LRFRARGANVEGMRAALLALVVACGPKVSTKPPTFDEDIGNKEPVAAAPVNELTMERAVAPPGKGLRSGTIARDRLIAVLDAGPASFLRQFEVTARMSGNRFVGWQLVQLVGTQANPLYDIDLVPGDILLTINGKAIARPDQLQTVWDGLRTADAVSAQLWRGNAKLTIEFSVEPKLGAL
jgi:type II secretory pathway component PulC